MRCADHAGWCEVKSQKTKKSLSRGAVASRSAPPSTAGGTSPREMFHRIDWYIRFAMMCRSWYMHSLAIRFHSASLNECRDPWGFHNGS